jgi:hypothetical protein
LQSLRRLLGLAVLALVLVGCGSSSDDGGGGGTTQEDKRSSCG